EETRTADSDIEIERPMRPLRSFGRLLWIGAFVVLAFAAGAAIYLNRESIDAALRSLTAALQPQQQQSQPQREASPRKNTDRLGQPENVQAPKAPVAQRAMLTTEPDAANPSGKDYVGSAIWSLEKIPAAPGRDAEVAIKLAVEIPERGLAMTWLI